MQNRPAEQWEHTTTLDSKAHGEPVGIDLFDETCGGIPMTAIYERFANGFRFPARTVNMTVHPHAEDVISAWVRKHPDVRDYRATPSRTV